MREYNYIRELARRFGMTLIVYDDLTVMDWSAETSNAGVDVKTFTASADGISFYIEAGPSRTWVRSFPLPVAATAVCVGAFSSGVNISSTHIHVEFWGDTPSADFSGANYNALEWITSIGMSKSIAGARTTLDAAQVVGIPNFQIAFASKPDNKIWFGQSPYGRKIVGVTDVAYPADSQLNQLTHVGFGIGANGATARLIVSAPLYVAYK